MRTKKTVSFEKLLAKANFDILVGTYVHGKKDVALAKYNAITDVLLSFGGYAGFGFLTENSSVEMFLREYNATSNRLYNEEEIQMVLDAHTADLNRIADMWYNETGNALPDVIDNGEVKDLDLYSEWRCFSAKHFEAENWVCLF